MKQRFPFSKARITYCAEIGLTTPPQRQWYPPEKLVGFQKEVGHDCQPSIIPQCTYFPSPLAKKKIYHLIFLAWIYQSISFLIYNLIGELFWLENYKGKVWIQFLDWNKEIKLVGRILLMHFLWGYHFELV